MFGAAATRAWRRFAWLEFPPPKPVQRRGRNARLRSHNSVTRRSCTVPCSKYAYIYFALPQAPSPSDALFRTP
eukprot:1374769-Prorocentrum_lima.AAC.1